MSRSISFHALCVRADPEFVRRSRVVTEYEFTSPGGRSRTGSERTHDGGGLRIFVGDYQERGPYTAVAVGSNDITWNGVPITFDGEPLTFTD